MSDLVPCDDPTVLAVSAAGAALPVTWDRALQAWLRNKIQNENTRRAYGDAVRLLFTTPGAPDLADMTPEALDAFGGALRAKAEPHRGAAGGEGHALAPATVNMRLAAMRSFLAFCRRRGWLSERITAEVIADALESVRAEVKRPYEVVERDETPALLRAAAYDRTDPQRAVALLALGLGAGLRVAELCALSVGDIRRDAVTGYYVDVREGKGRKQRQVPISSSVARVVAEYLRRTGRDHETPPDAPLFLQRKRRVNGGRLSPRHARAIVVDAARRAGLLDAKRITPHALRHSYALSLLMGDEASGRPPAPLPAVSKLLGHSNVAVTGRYLDHFDRAELAKYAPALGVHGGGGC